MLFLNIFLPIALFVIAGTGSHASPFEPASKNLSASTTDNNFVEFEVSTFENITYKQVAIDDGEKIAFFTYYYSNPGNDTARNDEAQVACTMYNKQFVVRSWQNLLKSKQQDFNEILKVVLRNETKTVKINQLKRLSALEIKQLMDQCSKNSHQQNVDNRDPDVNSRHKRFIDNWKFDWNNPLTIPGTQWCGKAIAGGAKPSSEIKFPRLDKCCREHHRCNTYINPGETKYGLTNTNVVVTLFSCACEKKFGRCAHQSEMPLATYAYFTYTGYECINVNGNRARKRKVDGFVDVVQWGQRIGSRILEWFGNDDEDEDEDD